MIIQKIRAWKRSLAIKRPYTIARTTYDAVDIVFLEITLQDGTIGLGSSSTDEDVVGENAGHTLANLESDLVQQFTGTDIRKFQSVIQACQTHFAKFPGTRAAIDMALHDAFCQWLDVSVVDFYGRHHQQLLTSVTIGIKDVAETMTEASEYVEAGFRALKVKTGLNPQLDAERIIRLREKYGRQLLLRVDANTGYSMDDLAVFLDATSGMGVELIEQPLPPGKEAELLRLPASVRASLAADESLHDARAALALSIDRPFGIFNIKLMKCGGIQAAFEIATIARQAEIQLFWGCNDESMVSIAAALHAAFACPHTGYIDLDGSFDLAEDIVSSGFVLEHGYMSPNMSTGLGLNGYYG